MWKFTVFILAYTAVQITAITVDTHHDEGLPVMRRDLGAEHAAAATVPAGLLQNEEKSVDESASADDQDGDNKAQHRHQGQRRQAPGIPPVESGGMQAFDRLAGPIPSSQRPMFALVFLFLAGVAAYGFYIWRMRAKTEQQAAMRRRMLRMRAAAAAAGADHDAKSRPEKRSEPKELPVSEEDAPPPPQAKGVGKGFGKTLGKTQGKTLGKSASGKGAKGPEDEQQAPMPGGKPSGVKGSKGKAAGKGPKGAEQDHTEAAGLGLGLARFFGVSAPEAPEAPVGKGSGKQENAPEAPAGKGSGKQGKPASVRASVASYVVGAPSGALKELRVLIQSVEKIQAVWRIHKANQKTPVCNQRITVVCDVLEGVDMPNVNRFGGCDPFVECRIVRGDPTHKLRGDVDKEPMLSTQTDVKRNDMAPSWRQRLALPDLTYEKDLYVQLVLWDYSLVRNQPIGHVAVPLEQALSTYSPKHSERFLRFSNLPGLEEVDLKAKVSAQFTYWEAYHHRLVVDSGSLLPTVKTTGTISSYIEARILQSDPRKDPFTQRPTLECLWSGRTGVVSENTDPCWQQEFDFTLAYDVSSLWLQLILWDINAPLPDVAIGHAVMSVSQAQSGDIANLLAQDLCLEDLPETPSATDLSSAKLAVRMGNEVVSNTD